VKAGKWLPEPDRSRFSSGAEPVVRSSTARRVNPLRSLRCRLGPPVVLVGAFYVGFVTLRLLEYDVIWFVHLGRVMLESSTTSSILTPNLGWQSEIGYDGQYYYAIAVDPANASDYITGSKAGYVYSRPVFPAVSRIVALGRVELVPYTMLLVNLGAVLLGTLAVAGWLRRNGSSPWLSVLFGLYPGLVFSVFRDLTEPLAYGLVAIALWLFDPKDRQRVLMAGAILALAALTRETVVVFSLVAAVALFATGAVDGQRLWSWSRWRAPSGFLVLTVAPLLVWKAIVAAVLDVFTQETPGGAAALIPFYGIASYWPWDAQHILVVTAVIAPALLAVLLALRLLAGSGPRLYGVLLILNAAAFVVFLPSAVYVDFGAAGRAATGLVLATVCCVPAWRALDGRMGPILLVCLMWSLPWYLVMAATLGLPGLDLITT